MPISSETVQENFGAKNMYIPLPTTHLTDFIYTVKLSLVVLCGRIVAISAPHLTAEKYPTSLHTFMTLMTICWSLLWHVFCLSQTNCLSDYFLVLHLLFPLQPPFPPKETVPLVYTQTGTRTESSFAVCTQKSNDIDPVCMCLSKIERPRSVICWMQSRGMHRLIILFCSQY